MRTVYLKKLIEEASAYNLSSLTAYIQRNFKRMNCQVYTYNGYAFTISGFLDYYRASMGILSDTAAMEAILCNKEMPIFTRVHNSAPTFYKASSSVTSSMLADECVIEGTVINSVLFRGVRVGRGAVVKNSILLKGTEVKDNARLNYIVSDKNVVIGEGVSLSGNANIPFYIQKGRRV
jgi:glucose-1-phosphate adenylyltransferase